jgi:hypothetical protein
MDAHREFFASETSAVLGACFFDLFGISLPSLRMQARQALELSLVILQQGVYLVLFDSFVDVGLESSFECLEEVTVTLTADARRKMHKKLSLFLVSSSSTTDVWGKIGRCRPVWPKRALSW